MNSGAKTMSEVCGLPEWLVRGLQWRPDRSGWRKLSALCFGSRSAFEEDVRLAADAAAGRAEAIELLIRRVKPQMLKVARAVCPTSMEPSRLAEVLFLKVFRMLRQYRGDRALSDWSARIAVGVALREVAVRQPRCAGWRGTEADRELLRHIDGNDGELTHEQRVKALRLLERLFDGLMPAERLVKRFGDLEGLSEEEICRCTGWSAAKTARIARNARRRVDEMLAHALVP